MQNVDTIPTDHRPFALDLSSLGKQGAPDPGSPRWSERVRRADPEARRYLGEAWISLNALSQISKDTGRTEFAFEAMENFPIFDVMRAASRRLPILKSPELQRLYEQREMPDLRTGPALALSRLPPGSVGHEYARYVAARKLDNAFLEYMSIDGIEQYFAFRTAHLHDLFHFLLGYDPFDPIGEMEIEAFLFAQTGALNHVLFMLGYAVFLLRHGKIGLLRAAAPRLRAAHTLGRQAESLLLKPWEQLLERDIDEVKRELGIASRPLARIDVSPRGKPRLAHVVLNVRSRREAERFYTRVFGYSVTGRDEALGVTFLSDGTDHHTLALSETPGLLSLWKLVPRAFKLISARARGGRSAKGQRRVLPTLPILRAAMRPGLMHMGFRVEDERELQAHLFVLRSACIDVEWAVDHDDMIKGFYFKDTSGNLCEIFCDGARMKQILADARAAGGIDQLELPTVDVANYELDLDALS